MIVSSIDIGIQHLGLVKFSFTPGFKKKTLLDFDLVDIQEFHPFGDGDTCALKYHDRCFSDWVAHVCQNFHKYFDDDVHQILIERQPPQGLVVIEQLLMSRFRDRVTLIHPRSMHCYIGSNDADYEGRKRIVERRFLKFLRQCNPSMETKFDSLERRHDVADAFCQLEFFAWTQRKRLAARALAADRERRRKELLSRPCKGKNLTLGQFFEQCKFRPTTT